MLHFRMTLGLMLLLTTAASAQTTCPPLPEGSSCDRYHYHVSIWDIDDRMYSDIAATEGFASMTACEAAREQTVRENAALVDFIRTAKIDGSMMADRFSPCHCDRTSDMKSPSFLDAKARTTQVRARQEAAWALRQRLLSRDLPGAADRVNMLFGRRLSFDRFLGETMPRHVTATPLPPARVSLLDSSLSAPAATPPIAANISLAAIPTPAAAPPAAKPATSPPPPAPAPPQPSTTTTGSHP